MIPKAGAVYNITIVPSMCALRVSTPVLFIGIVIQLHLIVDVCQIQFGELFELREEVLDLDSC